MTLFRSSVLVALGGNQPSVAGPAVRTLVSAIAALPDEGLAIRAVSRFFRTPCFPAGAGPDFANAVVCAQSDLAPDAILAALHRIEGRFGRRRDGRWGPRTLDLDLLAVGALVLPEPEEFSRWHAMPAGRQASTAPDRLILPHPRLHERAFVLVPLADVAPDWAHPALGQSAAELLFRLPRQEVSQVHPL